jgi:adenylate kinase
MSNVCFLFGINGVGKTTLVHELSARISGSIIINASEKLREVFGGLTREQLERLAPEEKKNAMGSALLKTFIASGDAPIILCDTHLTVPIRKAGVLLRYERMWNAAFESFAMCFCLITAPSDTVMERRKDDLLNGIRSRDIDPKNIAADAIVIANDFVSHFGSRKNAFTITNIGPIEEVSSRFRQLVTPSY